MYKILLILILILVIIFNIFAFLLGTVRRFFGFAPKRRKSFFERIFSTPDRERFSSGEDRKGVSGDVLYKNNDVTVLRGEAKKKKDGEGSL